VAVVTAKVAAGVAAISNPTFFYVYNIIRYTYS